MKFIVEFYIWRQIPLKKRSRLLVLGFAVAKAMPAKDAVCIGIHNKRRVLPGIKQNRVGGFGADAVNEQTAPVQAHVVEALGLGHLGKIASIDTQAA